ncbi:hypothetical protein P3S67_020907 [Capsicum chacoense]
MDIASSQAKFDEKTIFDKYTKDTYLLEKAIGTLYNGRCRVYKALYSQNDQENDMEFNELQRQSTIGVAYIPHANVIGSMRAFRNSNLFCVSLPYMSVGSLRYILSTRTNKKLQEDFICVVLKQLLVGLRDELHVGPNPRVHKTLNAGDIFAHIDGVTGEMLIKLAFQASVYHSGKIPHNNHGSASSFLDVKSIYRWGAAQEVFGSENENSSGPKSDIWLLGITALELAYGNLAVRNRGELNYIIKNIREKNNSQNHLKGY